MLIPFADWTPDLADLNATVTSDLQNVLPAGNSYIPAPALVDLSSNALPAKPLGAFTARQLDGTITIFAGTATKLYKLDNTTLAWTDLSGAAIYGATDLTPWDFAQFGEYVVAVNQNDNPQVFQLGVSSAFAALAGSPPKAGQVRVWGDFLALMNLTSNPNRVQWSALNNITGWTPGTNNSDYQDFPDGGAVQGSSEETNPIIFQERAIRRGTFVPGSTEVFTFQKVHDAAGAKSAKSIAYRDIYTFFADEGGFFQVQPYGTLMSPSGMISPIGFEKVDKTIFGALQSADIANIMGALDPFFSRVYWAVDLSGSGIYDTIVVYDWNLQKWAQLKANVLLVFTLATAGYTLDGLDSVSASLDALPFSLDSKAWQGGAPLIGAFTSDYKLAAFSGQPMEATLTTQETGDTAGQIMRMTSIYPVVDTSDLYLSVGARMRRSDLTTWLPEQQPSANTGIVRKRVRARFTKVKLRIPAGASWTHAQGVDLIDQQPAGNR